MSSLEDRHNFLVLGAGVIGLTTALVLHDHYPTSKITIVAKHFPGDRSIGKFSYDHTLQFLSDSSPEYTSPWAGANWCSMAHDNGPLEGYDEVTFR